MIFFLLLHPNKKNESKGMALAYELDFSEDSHWQISLSVLLELSCEMMLEWLNMLLTVPPKGFQFACCAFPVRH